MSSKLIKHFKKPRAYTCGGEEYCEFTNYEGCKARIYYRKPTSDEVVNYTYASACINSGEDGLRKLKEELRDNNKTNALYHLTLRELFIPYALKVILRWEGYKDANGKVVTEFDTLVKFYSSHVANMCALAYLCTDKYKKKT